MLKIRTYKAIVGALALVLAGTLVFSVKTIYEHDMKSKDEKTQLVIENERLRSFNVRRERRLKWMSEPKAINLTNVALAFNVLGTKPSVVAALLYTENAPEFVESGSLDKSDYFARNFPIEQWSVLEGSRTLNRMAWNWILDDPKRAHAFFLYASKPYTGLSVSEQKQWANNMLVSEKRFRDDIVDAGGVFVENPVQMKVRTPSATPTVSQNTKKQPRKRNIFVQ